MRIIPTSEPITNPNPNGNVLRVRFGHGDLPYREPPTCPICDQPIVGHHLNGVGLWCSAGCFDRFRPNSVGDWVPYYVYFYSDYWGHWSRVLARLPNGWKIEMDPDTRIRCHCTAKQEHDKIVVSATPRTELVPEWRDVLRLVTPEQILYANRMSNGDGVPLAAVQEFALGERIYWHNE